MSLYDLGDLVRLQLTTTDTNGDPADAGAVTLTIEQPDGTDASLGALTHTPLTGIYGYNFPPTMLGAHVADWTATGTNQARDRRRLDVYGATICDPAELRSRYPDLASTATYPDSKVREALRASVEQWNTLARVSMAPFASRLTRVGNGRTELALPHVEIRSIVSLTIDGTLVDPASYFVDGEAGLVELLTGVFTYRKAVVVHYEHGLDSPPGPVVDAVKQRAVELLVPPQSGLGRMTSVANDLGYARLSLAGRDGSTGVPDFDSTAALFGRQAALGFA